MGTPLTISNLADASVPLEILRHTKKFIVYSLISHG